MEKPLHEWMVSLKVPNVPCGVERQPPLSVPHGPEGVPNVPCGVESLLYKKKFFVVLSS